jgi:hypothetical protein
MKGRSPCQLQRDQDRAFLFNLRFCLSLYSEILDDPQVSEEDLEIALEETERLIRGCERALSEFDLSDEDFELFSEFLSS